MKHYILFLHYRLGMCSVALGVSNSLQSYGLQPTRLLYPWGFSRQEYWSELPCPPPGDLPNPGIQPRSPTIQADSLPSEPPGKTIALTLQTFVSRVMSLLSNTLSLFVITFLPRSNHLLISWLQSSSAVILEPKKRKSVTASTFSHAALPILIPGRQPCCTLSPILNQSVVPYRVLSVAYLTIKVMLKILHTRFQHYANQELPDVQAGFRK